MVKKIVFVVERLSTGGAERVVAALANEVCKFHDCEAYIVTYHSEEMDEYNISSEVCRIALEKPNKGRLSTIYQRYLQLKKVIYGINPYCVFSLAIPKTDAVLMAALRKRKFPLIISERNDPARFPAKKSMRILRDYVYKRCDGMVFQTQGAQEYFNEVLKCDSTVICNPITAALPKRYEGEREHRIVNFCRIEPQKNLKMTIDAFELIHKEFPDYTLEFYGEGSQKCELEQYVKKISLADKVIFHGYSPNIHEKILKAALYVSSSDYEGISNSMLEAMAIGIPTICTNCPPGGAKSVIHDGENGLLVPVGDVKKMADTIRVVLADKDLQNRLSVNATQLAVLLQPELVAKKWMEFAEKVKENEC